MPADQRIAQHTPGPWDARPKRGDTDSWWVTASPKHWYVAECVARQAENEANARLIAAAPDLLVAAQAALAYDEAIRQRGLMGDKLERAPGLPGALAEGHDLDALYWDWQSKAIAAIAKAEGRS